MKKLFLVLIVLILFSPQITAQTKSEKKEQRELKSQKEYEEIKDLVNSKLFEFNADWLLTKGNRINIAMGSNTLTVSKDSTRANMQYFGVVTTIGARGSEGVSFDNVINDYKVKHNDRKKNISVSYTVKNKTENFNINLSIYSSGKAYVDVYSNNKTSVTYDGNVSAIKSNK